MAGAPPPCSPLSWSDLPLDLAGMVLDLLPSHVDRVRFSAVCVQWFHAARQLPVQQPPLPLLLRPDGTLHSLPWSEPFHVSGCAGYGSACGKWLVFSRDDSGCFLMDPFSKATVTLPALASIRRRFGESYFVYQMGITQMMIKESKQILFSPHLVAAIFSIHWSSHIALCRSGCSLWWIVTEKQFGWEFSQMSFHKGNLYILTCNEDLLAANITKDDITGNPWVSHLGQVIKGPDGVSSTFTASRNGRLSIKVLYLVESRDMLLMVRRTLFCRCRRPSALALKDMGIVVERNDFKVFEPDLRQLRWAEVKTIGGDQSLFLGRRCSRAMSVSQYDMPGNHIFFLELDDDDRSLYGEKSLSSCSAYNIRDGTFSSPLPTVSWKRGMGFATWLFPQN